MVPWHQLATVRPDLADAGERLLFQFGVGLAFLATLRKDGAPRVHPVCPALSEGHLYVLIRPTSPKKRDLLRDGRYALQAFPPPRKESEEFYISGRADLIEDSNTRMLVFNDAKHSWREDEVLFELMLDRAMQTTWEGWGTPDLKPVHRSWHAVPT